MPSVMQTLNNQALARMAAIISMLFATALTLLVFLNLDKGFSFNDESMYLYSIAYPERLLLHFSDFGALLNYVFVALGKDFYIFRLVTFGALFFSANILIISFILLCRKHVELDFWHWCSIYSTLWCCTLGYYTYWLPTASYNTVGLIGIFATFAALNFYSILSRPKNRVQKLQKWHNILKYCVIVVLSLAGVLTFIGKPTSGVGVGIIACIWMYYATKSHPRREYVCHIALAAILALVFLVIYIFYISQGLETIRTGLGVMKILGNSHGFGYTLENYINFFMPTSYVIVLITWPLWALALLTMHRKRYIVASSILLLIVIISFVGAYIWMTGFVVPLMFMPMFVATCIGAYIWRRSLAHFYFSLRLAMLFFLLVFIYHAGSGTTVALKLSESFIFAGICIFSLCMAMQASRREIMLPISAIILCCFTCGTLFYSIFAPTRHNEKALWELTEPVTLRPNTKPIFVHPERKAFMDWIVNTAYANGWKEGSPLINTSYYTTGSLVLLDGYRMASAWAIHARHVPKGGYPIIFSFANPQDLQKAWIIKPVNDGPRHMPTEALKEIGLPFPEGYELLSTSPQESVQGIWPPETYEMWKPKP